MAPRAAASRKLKRLAPARAPAKAPRSLPHPDLAYAREVMALEAQAIQSAAQWLDAGFAGAVQALQRCAGRVVVTGMGKAGFIAQRLSAIFASTGAPSLYLHPAEAVHGDLGRVAKDDLLVAISNSGATEEILRLLPSMRRLGVKVIAVTGQRDSPLARQADWLLDIGPVDEACPMGMGMVPTASSAALHALGDALAMAVARNRSFTTEEYARFHPGGSLGRQMMRVSELMRTGASSPVVGADARLADALLVMTNTPGRPGCAIVTDRAGKLAGIFTDGDLRRLVEQGMLELDRRVSEVMTRGPATVRADARVADAAVVLHQKKIDQLPVVDGAGRAIGLLDVQDLLAARFF